VTESSSTTLAWIRLGVVAGLASCLVYPALVFLPVSGVAAAALAAAWGPLLGVASMGLGKLLQVHRRSVAVQLAVGLNFAAGALVTAMLLVQLAVGARAHGGEVSPELVAVWLGLDVTWDVYVGLGTGLFALEMLRHPRFMAAFGVPGILIAAVLLTLNLGSFPTPPADAGLFDAGPLVGLWYLAVSVQAWRSLGWAKTRLTVASLPAA
jgi:hypothetical protein